LEILFGSHLVFRGFSKVYSFLTIKPLLNFKNEDIVKKSFDFFLKSIKKSSRDYWKDYYTKIAYFDKN
jgi:hypothetical protein